MATVLDVQHQVVERLPPHRRNDSGELDVFDAASYFSGEERWRMDSSLQTIQASQMGVKWDLSYIGGGRKSVDAAPLTYQTQKQKVEKKGRETKSKTTGSMPRNKLANFLNSLFQSAQRKKKSTQNGALEEIAGGGRRRRRRSISHLQSISDTTTASLYSYPSPSPSFEPTLSLNTKIYKEINGCADTSRSLVAPSPPLHLFDGKRCANISWLGQKLIFSDTDNALKASNVYVWKGRSYADYDGEMRRKSRIFERDEGKISDATEKITEIRKKNWTSQDHNCMIMNVARRMEEDQMEDGFESDSDLFELRSFDLENN